MPNLLLFAALGAIALAERSSRLRYEALPFVRRHFATDLFYFATGAVGLGLATRAAAQNVSAAGVVAWPALGSLPTLPGVALAIVLYDLGAYATHALLHRFAWLWRFHKPHHSSRKLDWLATFRAHAFEHALRHLASPVVLLLAGLPPLCVAIAGAIYTVWAALNHSNLKVDLRWLEPVLITPRLHRLHHVPATSHANLGTIFSLWDRALGRLVRDPHADQTPLGVPGELETYPQTWAAQLVEPLVARRDAH